MKKVLFVAHFMDVEKNSNNRFNYIIEALLKKDIDLEVITSSFSHREKTYRKHENKSYKLTLIDEPRYKKNVSLRRFYSHYIMAIRLKRYLKKIKDIPDIIYCAVPSLDVAKVMAKYAKKNKVKFIIDIQDLWPEAFKMIFNIPIISDMIFLPMNRKANYVYKNADSIIAVSETYLDRAKKVNRKSDTNKVIFLGTDKEKFDSYKNEVELIKSDNIIKIVYIGTLGYSYNLKIIIDAIKILNDKGINNIKFYIMGDGPLRKEFEEYANEKKVDCIFTGMIQYNKMVGQLCDCDIAVNPIVKRSAGSIINKVGDYAMAGLPVINTQENKEYRDLIEQYKIGYNCDNDNIVEISEKIEKLIENKKLRMQMGNNNRKLAEEKFDRKETYKNIIEMFK